MSNIASAPTTPKKSATTENKEQDVTGKELKKNPTASPLITTTTENQVPAAALANKASVKPADIDSEQIKSAVPSKGNDDKEVEAVPPKPADKTDPAVASPAAASVAPSAASAAPSDIDGEFTAEQATALEFGAVPDVVQVNKQTFAEHGNAGAASMFDAFVHALQLNKIAYEVRTDMLKNEYIETKATVQIVKMLDDLKGHAFYYDVNKVKVARKRKNPDETPPMSPQVSAAASPSASSAAWGSPAKPKSAAVPWSPYEADDQEEQVSADRIVQAGSDIFHAGTVRVNSQGQEIETAETNKRERFRSKEWSWISYKVTKNPHWLSSETCNIATTNVLKHLNAAELEKATAKIREHGHPDNIRMLADFAQWAKSNPFMRR